VEPTAGPSTQSTQSKPKSKRAKPGSSTGVVGLLDRIYTDTKEVQKDMAKKVKICSGNK